MQYPKMLYKGTQAEYEYQIANDEDHEAELIADDWVQYSDLPEPEPKIEEVTPSVSEKITWLEDQLATSQGEFIAFQNNIAAMKARIAELQGDTTPVGATSESVNYADWTADQLREELKNQGKEFKARDSKAELIAILEA